MRSAAFPRSSITGVTGLLVPPGDPAALAAALRALAADPARADRMGAAGRHAAETRFSFDRMVSACERLYLSELARRHAGVLSADATRIGHASR